MCITRSISVAQTDDRVLKADSLRVKQSDQLHEREESNMSITPMIMPVI